MDDWIETFMDYSNGLPTPEVFRLWSAIGVVAGALEQRVWTQTGLKPLYPHLYTLLVAPPGVGKTNAIDLAMELIFQSKGVGQEGFHIAPNSVTRASLIDTLAESGRKIIRPTGGLLEYHSLFISAGEFGVLVPTHDLEFLSVLNSIYDVGRAHRERRRGGNLDQEIIRPQLNILAGTQPLFLGSLLPEEAWGMGTTSRLILIYAPIGPKVKIFLKRQERPDLEKSLVQGIRKLTKLIGEMVWTDEAMAYLQAWVDADCPPAPTHSKLQNYNPRRWLHVMKLSMISAASGGCRLSVEPKDFLRARTWLLDAEATMPDIFRDMAGRSDTQVLQDLHYFLWQLYNKEKKPIHESRVIHWMAAKAPSDKIGNILLVAEKSGMISVSNGCYTPRPKHEHGQE